MTRCFGPTVSDRRMFTIGINSCERVSNTMLRLAKMEANSYIPYGLPCSTWDKYAFISPPNEVIWQSLNLPLVAGLSNRHFQLATTYYFMIILKSQDKSGQRSLGPQKSSMISQLRQLTLANPMQLVSPYRVKLKQHIYYLLLMMLGDSNCFNQWRTDELWITPPKIREANDWCQHNPPQNEWKTKSLLHHT